MLIQGVNLTRLRVTITKLQISTSGYQNLCSEQVEPQETNGLIMLHDVRVLKAAATEIAPIFQVMITSFHIGAVPQTWRSTNKAAFHKKVDLLVNPANYLPVSLTSVCFKS